MRLFILLCSDLAIRSGTAAKINAENYDKAEGVLRFMTKKEEPVTMPVTDEIRRLIDRCNMQSKQPFVRQIWNAESGRGKKKGKGRSPGWDSKRGGEILAKKFRKLKNKLGITRRITPHDLRRTTAVAMFEQTGDIRDVQSLLGHGNLQSTIWYLDHDLRPVKRSNLEIIKRPAWARKEVA
jgi:integrase/recombinase XerC